MLSLNASKENIQVIISIFIIFLLFFISLERIILHFKSKQAQEKKENTEIQYYELRVINDNLRKNLKRAIEERKRIHKFLLDHLSKKR